MRIWLAEDPEEKKAELILKLLKQYQSDCKDRISEIQDDLYFCDAEDANDLHEQIAHWTTTINQIENVLK